MAPRLISLPATIPHIGVRISQMRLELPRQWGTCWLGCELWQQLGLDAFWSGKIAPCHQGAQWDQILQTLVLYRLIDHSALADLLGTDFSLAEIHRLYECHDKILEHKIVLTRYTQPEKDLQLLLHQLQLKLPEQARPKIQAPANRKEFRQTCSADLLT